MTTQPIVQLSEQQAMALAQCFQLAITTDALSMAIKTLADDARSSGLEREFQIVVNIAREAAEHAAALQTIIWAEFRVENPVGAANDPE